jgi:hypothetical protein
MAFTFNVADLQFVLRQIKIAEAHSTGTPLTDVWVDAAGNIVPAGTLGAEPAISDPHMPLGLRTVDGSLNNLVPGRETWGATDQVMPRMLSENFINENDDDTMPFGQGLAVTNNDYGVVGEPTNITVNGGHSGNVADADPRIISNLISDMSTRNPAAVEVWFANEMAVAAWEEANPGLTPVRPGEPTSELQLEITDMDLALIPNMAPDDGISAPFNAWMTFFGQFFDHGLDLISKGNNGTIFIPLQADDPLRTHGLDGIEGSGDEVPPEMAFMALTRSTPFDGPGPDGVMGTADDTTHETKNTTTPFVDQNQTYTSHASHQVFIREYAPDASGRPQATGYLLDGQNGGLATWADVKAQAREMLGIELTDGDVLNVPLLRTDAYGEFIRDPATGYAQVILGIGPDGIPNTDDDIVASGTPDAPINTFTVTNGTLTGAIRVGHSFLDDIAHNANPSGGMAGLKTADTDNAIGLSEAGTYDNELLDRHFITGDGRGNENIGLTSVHHVFHSEHNRQVESQKAAILASGDRAFINEWLIDDIAEGQELPATLNWDGERLFQSAKFATEMQYQHLVFEEFGRKINPNIDPFVFNSVTDINPAIFAEFANTVYRFGHSMLTDSMVRIDANGTSEDVGLINAFLNPVLFNNDGAITADQAAGAVVRGMTVTQGNAIDEFVVSSLRSNLLGLPLDLPAINIARGRDTGVPTLNETRAELFSASNSTWLKPYESWVDFAANMRNPISVVNFIAAYGEHETILSETTLQGRRDAAMALVFGGEGAPADRLDFLTGSKGFWTAANSGLNNIDLWIGGLAERIIPFGGMLGATFSAVFEAQMEALQNGDRFYYLTRTQGQNMLNELEQNAFAKMIMANTDLSDPGLDGIRGTSDDVILRHIGADVFAKYDFVLEVMIENQGHPDPIGNDPVLQAMGLNKVQRDDPMTAGVDTNYLRFTGGEHVVLGGSSGNDTLISSDGDDAIWGDAGDDRIESGFGVDLVLGGAGNDVITDMGDEGDFLKGEDGDDVMTTAGGLDILMGGNGKDIISLGVDGAQVFGGAGDDFILGSSGSDFLMGNEGNDWIEGGGGFDTTAGDNSELFFNSAVVGHDVMFAGSDENDFDAESGDDIMVQGESVMRNEGMFGFDWAIFKGVLRDAYADMRIKIFTTEAQDILRNRFDKTEALSGWDYNDTLIGDDRISQAADPDGIEVGAGAAENVFFRDGLDQAGIDRIEGLSEIVSVAPGSDFWEEGNILLGGGGSDVMRGNGGDDILDGDRWLNVRIRITGDPTDENTAGNEIATVDSLKHVFTASDAADPSWVGKSLFELLLSRAIVPGQMNIVREILTGGVAGDTDIAIFNDDRGQYTITTLESGAIQVAHTGFGTNADVLIDDGVDTLHNIEVLRFRDGDVVPAQQAATGQPVISDTTPTEEQTLTVDLSLIDDGNGIDVSAIAVQWQSFDGTNWNDIVGATDRTYTPSDAPPDADGPQVGQSLRVAATFIDGLGGPEIRLSEATQILGDFWVADATNLNFRGGIGDDHAIGNAQRNDLRGGDGSDILEGGAGVDRLRGGAGNDLLVVNFATEAGGGDFLNGEGGVDTVEITGSGEATEAFGIYTRAAAVAAGLAVRGGATEIVITRSVGAVTEVIANLDNIEEIIVNMTDATPLANGVVGGAILKSSGTSALQA